MSDRTPGVPERSAATVLGESVGDTPSEVLAGTSPATLLGQVLEDRLLFSHAQGLLAGLMDCTPTDAGRALVIAATELGLTPSGVAESFMELMASADGAREPLMLLLAAATGLPADRVTALETLWDAHGAACYALAVAILGNDHLAAEVVRSVFLTVWRKEEVLADTAARQASLLGDTRRGAILALRNEPAMAGGLESGTGVFEPAGIPSAGGHPVRPEVGTIANLSDSQERVLRLAYFGGQTQRQIAHSTGTSVEEVRATMLAAMNKLAAVRRLRAGLPAHSHSGGRPHGDTATDHRLHL